MTTNSIIRSGLAAALAISLAACEGASAPDEDADVIAGDLELDPDRFEVGYAHQLDELVTEPPASIARGVTGSPSLEERGR